MARSKESSPPDYRAFDFSEEVQGRIIEHLSSKVTSTAPKEIAEFIEEELRESDVTGRYPAMNFNELPVRREITRNVISLIEQGKLTFTKKREIRIGHEPTSR